MPSGGSCLLGSINLAAFVKDDKFDFDGFKQCVEDAIVGLNEVLDEGLELHPLQVQRDSVRDWRQVGLGILGLADMLIKLRIKYGSEESIELCDKIGAIMSDSAIRASSMLAKENGVFNRFNIQNTKASPYFQFNASSETRACVNMYGLRNSQLLTIAPTGLDLIGSV